MSISPAKPPLLAKRDRLQFNEVLALWQWTANDLKEVVISGQLAPCLFEKGAVWPMRVASSGKRTRVTPAIFVDQWMYLVGVKQTGPFDCHFDFFADEYNSLQTGNDVYKREGNGYVDNRVTLSEVIERGAFASEELQRYENEHGPGNSAGEYQAGSKRNSWWKEQYKVELIATNLQAQWKSEERGVNHSGARAGKYSLTALGEAVAAQIENSEKAKKSPRTITGKSIVNFLKAQGWDKAK